MKRNRRLPTSEYHPVVHGWLRATSPSDPQPVRPNGYRLRLRHGCKGLKRATTKKEMAK